MLPKDNEEFVLFTGEWNPGNVATRAVGLTRRGFLDVPNKGVEEVQNVFTGIYSGRDWWDSCERVRWGWGPRDIGKREIKRDG